MSDTVLNSQRPKYSEAAWQEFIGKLPFERLKPVDKAALFEKFQAQQASAAKTAQSPAARLEAELTVHYGSNDRSKWSATDKARLQDAQRESNNEVQIAPRDLPAVAHLASVEQRDIVGNAILRRAAL
jgi:hypothetical protein